MIAMSGFIQLTGCYLIGDRVEVTTLLTAFAQLYYCLYCVALFPDSALVKIYKEL